MDSQYFSVEASTGKVLVQTDRLFDRETQSQYFVKVKATDGAPSARPGARGQPNSRKSLLSCDSVPAILFYYLLLLFVRFY